MARWPKDRQISLNPWSALLAVVLGILAVAGSALATGTSVAGGQSVAERGLDPRAPWKPTTVGLEAFDPASNLRGSNGPDSAITACAALADAWAGGLEPTPACDFGLPDNAAHARNGLTRAPPVS